VHRVAERSIEAQKRGTALGYLHHENARGNVAIDEGFASECHLELIEAYQF